MTADPRYLFEPIGVARSPFTERAAAPRQPADALDAPGRIELFAGRGYEHALEGLDGFERVWIVFVFHRNVEQARGWKAKVLPPRSDRKRGLFATRSPHRPNPIGLSAVTVERLDGLVLHVRGLDLLDATPVLDLKPYVAYTDAYPNARAGWLASPDPISPWEVSFADLARDQLQWLSSRGLDLGPAIERALEPGPQPNPYRRIRKRSEGLTLAIKDWRVDFVVEGRRIVVARLRSGYRTAQRLGQAGLELHTAYAHAWESP